MFAPWAPRRSAAARPRPSRSLRMRGPEAVRRHRRPVARARARRPSRRSRRLGPLGDEHVDSTLRCGARLIDGVDLLHEDRPGVARTPTGALRDRRARARRRPDFREGGFEDLVDERAGREVDGERTIGQLSDVADELTDAVRVEQSGSHRAEPTGSRDGRAELCIRPRPERALDYRHVDPQHVACRSTDHVRRRSLQTADGVARRHRARGRSRGR